MEQKRFAGRLERGGIERHFELLHRIDDARSRCVKAIAANRHNHHARIVQRNELPA